MVEGAGSSPWILHIAVVDEYYRSAAHITIADVMVLLSLFVKYPLVLVTRRLEEGALVFIVPYHTLL
jgi:hypothetical protein